MTLRGFVDRVADAEAPLNTDEASAYRGMREEHVAVKHSVGQYVDRQASVNGIESFWALLKRGYHSTYHKISPEHLQRYVDEFAGRHNARDRDTADQMAMVVAGMVGRRLMYRDLVAKWDSWTKRPNPSQTEKLSVKFLEVFFLPRPTSPTTFCDI